MPSRDQKIPSDNSGPYCKNYRGFLGVALTCTVNDMNFPITFQGNGYQLVHLLNGFLMERKATLFGEVLELDAFPPSSIPIPTLGH